MKNLNANFKLIILFLAFSSTLFSAPTDSCSYLKVSGNENDLMGTVAYNDISHTGHQVVVPAASIPSGYVWAYYYLHSRDFITNSSQGGMRVFNDMVNWPNLATALSNAQLSPTDITLSFTGSTLGNDIQGTDWWIDGLLETRIYRGGTYQFKVAGENIITGNMPDFTMLIKYRTQAVDSIYGYTGSATATNNSQNSSATAQAIAEAFMQDCENNTMSFQFTSMQKANQGEYTAGSRSGAFYNIDEGYIFKTCNEQPVDTTNNNENPSCAGSFSVTGMEALHQGVAAFNSSALSPEGANSGHLVTIAGTGITNVPAYYFLSGRDYAIDDKPVDASSTSSMKGFGNPVDWPNLTQALTSNGKTLSDLSISFDKMSLGQDIEGVDWNIQGLIEKRIYKGGMYIIKLNGEDVVSGIMPDFTLEIKYKIGGVDSIKGYTETTYAMNHSFSSSAAAQAIADALTADVPNGFYFEFESLQEANQSDFNNYGRVGAYYNIDQGRIKKVCLECDNFKLQAPDTVKVASGENISIDVLVSGGAEPYEVNWNPGLFFQDPMDLNSTFSISQDETIQIYVRDANGCFQTKFIYVDITGGVLTKTTSSDSEIQVKQTNGRLAISNLAPNSKIEIYTINGYKMVDRGNNESQITLELPEKAMYILKISNEQNITSRKISVF